MADSIFAQEAGPVSGKPVLLLHGLGATSDSWAYQVPALAEAGWRVIAPDVPGFGRSPWSGGRWTVARAARRLQDWLDQGSVPHPLAVVGISMGGVLAQEITLQAPLLVSRLCLINTFGRLSRQSGKGLGYYLRRLARLYLRGVRSQADLVAGHLFPLPGQELLRQALIEQVATANERVYRQAMISLGLINLEPQLPQIRVPTLVITGACDGTVPPTDQARLSRLIPGARQHVVQGAGHAVTVTHPDEVNQAILVFLEKR